MEHIPMTPFDLLTSSESTRMLKLMLPFIAPSSQRSLALLIKVTELQQTATYFKGFSTDVTGCSVEEQPTSITDILHYIKDYMSKSQQESLDSINQFMEMMELFSQMNSSDDSTENPFSGLANMFSGNFADMFSGGFPDFNFQGGESNEPMDESSGFSEDGPCQTEVNSDCGQSD